eukprot:5703023-Prymnesium_polylepis.2
MPPAPQIGSVNPILVMLLIPTFSGLPPLRRDGSCHWRGLYTLAEERTGLRLTPLRKIGLGLFVTVPGFGISILVELCATTRGPRSNPRDHTRRLNPRHHTRRLNPRDRTRRLKPEGPHTAFEPRGITAHMATEPEGSHTAFKTRGITHGV